MERFIKFIWFVSLLIGLASLLYTYAAVPEQISIGDYSFSNEMYFYGALVLLVVFNFSFYALSKNLRYVNEHLQLTLVNWQLSFASVLNLFFIVSVFMLMMANSGERFNYDNFGYLVYIALGLIVIWILLLPVLFIRESFRG